MFRNNIKNVYTNKNGNEFAVILISKKEDIEAKFLNISTKLIQSYKYSTEKGKFLKRSEKFYSSKFAKWWWSKYFNKK